ncbi:hypothetical protein F2Q68_00010555 [Brassica cretica]|uniref:non-specific serine/threonine protein kinase n=1 Tax=Brassica cretica TaxID=69181 RepID=A0A8S9KNY9_BRACR|nr:hypothetical protein F2Q68_00010555 [Brassica cretica]
MFYCRKILGTSLTGPIPSSFSNLISLRELSIGDIPNGGSLKFIKDMKSLSILVLRNSNLTGKIPSNIAEYTSLQQVDLSFNKLHGPIPASLFSLSKLTHLFLGNNTLNGSLPTQKSKTLSNIDVSYNDLSGSLPSWVSLPNLKLNLVANNFTLKSLDKRGLLGLKCLQKNFPCNRGKGIYSDFFINCGGPQIRSVTVKVFEKENEDLGSASSTVSYVQRWAVSSVGLFAGSSNNMWVINSLDSEIFQSARHSSSSLRYYGLGLENGGYTVTKTHISTRVSDFGLAKLYDDTKTHISTRVAGTIGYLAPEYAMRGHLTAKTDVYAFGIVALELVSGRKNSDVNLGNEKKYLLEWAWNLHENSHEVELIDHELTEFNMEEVKRVIGIALLCTYSSHSLRPPMSKVVAMLSGALSAFQTRETGVSSSYSTSFVTPSEGAFNQMLGVKINEGR